LFRYVDEEVPQEIIRRAYEAEGEPVLGEAFIKGELYVYMVVPCVATPGSYARSIAHHHLIYTPRAQ
jgi:hypothetical protein